MQCFNCRFENMPGIAVCGRCGTSLHVATAVIDVNPPRARSWRKQLRRMLPVNRAAIKVRDASATATRQFSSALQDVGMPVPPARILWRLVVPRLAHFRVGQHYRGLAFLGAYLILLGLAVLFWGTNTGSIYLGLAFSVHASSALDVLFQYPGHIRSRVVIAGVVMAALGLGFYIPATRGLNVIAEPITITATMSPFAEGDVVLTNRWAYRGSSPQPGDVVLVELVGSVAGDGHGTPGLLIREGQFIDRILAGPGSEVAIESGRLSINGEACALEPLAKPKMPALLKFTLAADQYLILPSTLAVMNERLATPAHWKALCKVPRERILGRVYLRHQPLSRWWWIG
jgi:type IV secretory pathway protease TraF